MLELLLASCIATTTIAEFKPKVEKLCGPHIQSVAIEGDHNRLVYTMTFTADAHAVGMAGVPTYAAGQLAELAHEVLTGWYPAEAFELRMLDSGGRKLCLFVFNEHGMNEGFCPD